MNPMRDQIIDVLQRFLSELMSRSILNLSLKMANVDIEHMRPGDEHRLYRELERGVRIYLPNPIAKQRCTDLLQKALPGFGIPRKSE